MFRSIARERACLAALTVVLFCFTVSPKHAVAGKPGGGGGSAPPGTVYYVDEANYPDIWSMKADGSGKALAMPDGFGKTPSNLVYGSDRHRLWLGVENVPGQFYPYYSDPSQNTIEQSELFAYRRTPAGAVQKIQLTDLFPGIRVDSFPTWSNDGVDSFVSFKGMDARVYFQTGNTADLRRGIFRIRLSGADIDAAANSGQNLLLGIDNLEEVVSVYYGFWDSDLSHSWSPDGNQVAVILRSGATGDYGDLYAKDLTTGQTRLLYDNPVNYSAPGFRWSPAGGKLVLGFRESIVTIDANTGALLQTVLQSGTQKGTYTGYGRACWSPDATQFVILQGQQRSFTNTYSIARLPSTGGSLTTLTGDLDSSTNKYPFAWVSDTAAP